jgi:hypothetical protein
LVEALAHRLTDSRQTIDINADSNGRVTIESRKLSAGPRTIRKSMHVQSIRTRSGPRRSLGVASSQARRGYRPDLRTVGFFLSESPLQNVSFIPLFVTSGTATTLEPAGHYFDESWAWTSCKNNKPIHSDQM